MNNSESVNNTERINTLVEKLRDKLKDFKVMDRQGQLIGEVKDLVLDNNRQINLIVSELSTDKSSRLSLLMSKLVQKIDPPNKSVLIDINKSELEHFPEYVTTEIPGMEISPMHNNPIKPTDEAVADEGKNKDSDSFANIPSGSASVAVTSTLYSESVDMQNQPNVNSVIEPSDIPDVLEEEIIRLLGERLIVDRSKRKVGEVIVRKEIETRMIQVPVRREKLIIEQVSPERKQLAEIELGQEEISGIELAEGAITGVDISETISPDNGITSVGNQLTVRGEFNSPKIVSLLLNAIALERRHGCKKVRLEIVVEDAERQKTYQQWFERCSGEQQ